MTGAAVDSSYRAVLGISGVPRILASLAVGRIAASMASIVLVVFAIERYDSPALAGIVVFASTFPAVIMGPIAGALLDRHGRVRLVLLDQLVGAAALGVLAVLAGADRLPPWLLITVAGVASFTRPLSVIGLRTTLPMLVPQPLWPRVNALDSNAFVVATLIGPALAGLVLALAGGAAALAVVSVLLALAGVALVGDPGAGTRVPIWRSPPRGRLGGCPLHLAQSDAARPGRLDGVLLRGLRGVGDHRAGGPARGPRRRRGHGRPGLVGHGGRRGCCRAHRR